MNHHGKQINHEEATLYTSHVRSTWIHLVHSRDVSSNRFSIVHYLRSHAVPCKVHVSKLRRTYLAFFKLEAIMLHMSFVKAFFDVVLSWRA